MAKDAKSVFCKQYNVPYDMLPAVDKELDRMVVNNFLKKMKYSDWAAPFVTMPKADGEVR